MKRLTLTLVFVLSVINAFAQLLPDTEEKFALPSSLIESSGAIFFNNKLITHNDSGGESRLFELDTISGLVTKTVAITNATNVDWEDIAQDDSFIYIGDIGNNSGSRTDLKIYKVDKSAYQSSSSVTAEVITFNYSDQIDFTANFNNTEWDAEALVSFDVNNLMLFTKNWVDGMTKGYLIPKTPGNYTVNKLTTTLNSGGRITGGTYNQQTKKLYLIGYSQFLQPFVWESEAFSSNDIFSGTNTNTPLTPLGFEQAEAITYVDDNRYFITSESFSITSPIALSNYAKAVAFSTNDNVLSFFNAKKEDITVLYPNPVKDLLRIDIKGLKKVEIFDTKLAQVYQGYTAVVDLSNFKKGLYLVKIHLKNNAYFLKKVVKN